MQQEVVIEGPDTDGDGQPDFRLRMRIRDKRLWMVIVLLGFAVTVSTKLANLW